MNRPANEEQNPKIWHNWFETLSVGTKLEYRSGDVVRHAVIVKANFPSVSGRVHIYNCPKFTDTNTMAYHIWIGCFDVIE